MIFYCFCLWWLSSFHLFRNLTLTTTKELILDRNIEQFQEWEAVECSSKKQKVVKVNYCLKLAEMMDCFAEYHYTLKWSSLKRWGWILWFSATLSNPFLPFVRVKGQELQCDVFSNFFQKIKGNLTQESSKRKGNAFGWRISKVRRKGEHKNSWIEFSNIYIQY